MCNKNYNYIKNNTLELNKVEVKATIGDKDCYILQMRLEQSYYQHHKTDLIVDYENFDTLWMEFPALIFNMLGEEITVEMKHRKGDGLNLLPACMKTTLKNVDTFLVTSVVHEYDLKGEYRNTFTGIPSTVENVPMEPPPFLMAGPQLAWVKENVDPQKRGRIKVQTQWQKITGKTTNWIRVQTEDAGFSSVFAKNRGHTFLPEIGDQVMLDFEYGDPNRPYMAGAVFPETKSEGGRIDNNIKSIKTRSGHTMEYNDSEAKKSIFITDIAGNLVHWDTVSQQIKIFAPKKITIVSEDIEISASKSLVLSSGKDTQQSVGAEFRQTVGENHQLSVGDSLAVKVEKHLKAQTATGSINVQSGNEIIESAESNVKITSEEKTDIISQSDITIQSGSDVFIAK